MLKAAAFYSATLVFKEVISPRKPVFTPFSPEINIGIAIVNPIIIEVIFSPKSISSLLRAANADLKDEAADATCPSPDAAFVKDSIAFALCLGSNASNFLFNYS
mgnify:CR=1 FL=1